MTPRERLTAPETRTSLFYFTLFMGNGAAGAYLPIWLVEQGVTEGEIGYINAVPIIILIAINLFVGRIADRAQDWRMAIVVGTVLSGIAPFGLFFVRDFWGILFFYCLTMVPLMAIGPVADAAAIRMTRRRNTDFGIIRGWGTLGFMSFNALTGFLAAAWGAIVFIPIFAGAGLLRAAASLQLPRFRAGREATAPTGEALPAAAPMPVVATPPDRAKLREALKPWFVIALFGAALLYSSHFLLQGFAALIWKQAGISEAVIGPLVALGAGAEAIMMFAFRRVASRFTARNLMLAAAVTMAVRLAIMAMNPPVEMLFVLQSLHAVTFALGYLGTVNFIANWTSEDIAAEAQSFFAVLVQVIAAVAFIAFGYLVAAWGAGAFLAGAGMSAVGALSIVVSLRLRPAAR